MSKESTERVCLLRKFYEPKLHAEHVKEAICMNCMHYQPQEYQSCARPCVDHVRFEEKRKRAVRKLMRKLDIVDHFHMLYGPPLRNSSQ